MFTEILFCCLNINTDYLLSSNYMKLEKFQLKNLRFGRFEDLRPSNQGNTPKTGILKVGINICHT
jgi:hypothetical protein